MSGLQARKKWNKTWFWGNGRNETELGEGEKGVFWALLCAQGEAGPDNSEFMEALKGQVRVSDIWMLHPASRVTGGHML